MATSRGNKGKSSGLRMLWIPGGRKSHPKGRFDSTNKHVTHPSKQKKNEAWSLGGTRTQRDLLMAEPERSVLDSSPSVSGLVAPLTATCTIGAVGAASAAQCAEPAAATDPKSGTEPAAPATAVATAASGDAPLTPHTPNSTTSTAPFTSTPNSPVLVVTPAEAAADATTATLSDPVIAADVTMPAKTTTIPLITTTTTAEIIDENRFAVLGKDIPDELSVSEVPRVPGAQQNHTGDIAEQLNTSGGTTASTVTSPSPSASPKKYAQTHKNGKHSNHKNHNNNHQGDVNSIESITDGTKIPSGDLDWIDEFVSDASNKPSENGSSSTEHKTKRKKKKKLATATAIVAVGKEPHDQLDGVSTTKSNGREDYVDEDEKMVKCLYYTLMCCECTIS